MPDLPEALRDRSLEALEEADSLLLPALVKALNAVFGKVLAEMADHALLAAVSPDDFDGLVTDWADQVDKVVMPVVADLYEGSAEAAFRILTPTDLADFKVSDPAFREFMETAGKRIKDIGPETWSRVRDTLAEGIGNGETQRELQKRVREHLLVSRARAERIARTEARAARNGGAMAGARALLEHAPKFKQWIATLDGRTRHSHAAAEGQVRALDDRFDIGGVSLDYPGDPVGSAEEVVNCRCRWIAVDSPDAPALAHEGRQMEVSSTVEAEKRGAFKEVLVSAENRGLVAPRTLAKSVAELVAPATDFAARVQTLVANLGDLKAADPRTFAQPRFNDATGRYETTGRGTWMDDSVTSAPGPKALEFEANLRKLGESIDEEATKRMGAVLPVAERPTLAAVDAARSEWQAAQHVAFEEKDRLFGEVAQARYGKHRNLLDNQEWASVTDTVDVMTKDLTVAQRKLREAWQDLRELHEMGRVEGGLSAGMEYREKVLEVLAEIRGYGTKKLSVAAPPRRSTSATLNEGRDLMANDVGKYYPDEWIDDSNARGWVEVSGVKARAYHRWKGGYGGGDSEIQMSRRSANGMDPTGMLGNAVHEVGHRFEQLRPHIRTAEWAFHNRRTFKGGVVRMGQQEATQSLKRRVGGGYRADEVFREDEFLDPYIGKVYADTPMESWEVFQMGIQSLMGDGIHTIASDKEFLHLILGLLGGG